MSLNSHVSFHLGFIRDPYFSDMLFIFVLIRNELTKMKVSFGTTGRMS